MATYDVAITFRAGTQKEAYTESPFELTLREVFDFLVEWEFNPDTDRAVVQLHREVDHTEDFLWYFGEA